MTERMKSLVRAVRALVHDRGIRTWSTIGGPVETYNVPASRFDAVATALRRLKAQAPKRASSHRRCDTCHMALRGKASRRAGACLNAVACMTRFRRHNVLGDLVVEGAKRG